MSMTDTPEAHVPFQVDLVAFQGDGTVVIEYADIDRQHPSGKILRGERLAVDFSTSAEISEQITELLVDICNLIQTVNETASNTPARIPGRAH